MITDRDGNLSRNIWNAEPKKRDARGETVESLDSELIGESVKRGTVTPRAG
jgi:hypothetical protein